jgi:hypothetical protein
LEKFHDRGEVQETYKNLVEQKKWEQFEEHQEFWWSA